MFKSKSVESADQQELRQAIRSRLQEVQQEVAADYKIPEQLWSQMVNALVKGAPASGGAFSKEELAEFNDATRARMASFLAEATRGLVPNEQNVMLDSTGAVIGRVASMDEVQKKAQEERGA